ncbi:MAG: hypothetical protein NT069_16260 [Planctomycetota bacterium]|nr:hypothetical protein [Planctomycetota bacterium]
MNSMPQNFEQFSSPQLQLSFPAVAVLAIAAGLVVLAFLLMISVVRKANRPSSTVQTVKSGIGTLLWVAPALALIVIIGKKAQPTFTSQPPAPLPVPAQASHSPVPPIAPIQPIQPLPLPESIRVDQVGQVAASSGAGHSHAEPADVPPVQLESDLPPTASLPAETVTTVTPAGQPESVPPTDSGTVTVGISPITNLNEELGKVAPKTASRLTPRGETSSTPAWSGAERNPNDDKNRPVFRSGRYMTPEEATADVTTKAVEYVQRRFQSELDPAVRVTATVIDRSGVDELVLEKYQKVDELTDGRKLAVWMYIAHLKLNVGENLRNAVYADYRQSVVNQRLKVLGGGLGLVTLLLGTVAMYFRLDDATSGKYRTRLKLAAGAVIAAVGIAASVVA